MNLGGHDSYQTTTALHQKHKFKELALANGIKTPYAEYFDNTDNALQSINKRKFPLIIKPVDLTGGKGISKVNCIEEAEATINLALSFSRCNEILIENYIEGTHHSFSTFIVDQKVRFYFSDNEYSCQNKYSICTSAAPAYGIEETHPVLINQVEKLASLLSLSDGIVHLQYIQNDNEISIIEATRRCSGDFYPYPVNYATNLCWEDWIVKSETGLDCKDFPDVKQAGFVGRHCIMSPKNGVINDIDIDACLQENIVNQYIMWEKGDVIENHMTHKLAVVFLRYSSRSEMLQKTKNIHRLIKVNLAQDE